MQKFSSHHQLQLIIVLFISSVRVTSSKVLTILPTSTPANFSAPVHFDATQNLEESVIFKALKQFWWEYALNSKHQKNEVNNELSKIKALTPPEDTTAEHPHLHPYVDRLKIEMDEMVHQRQRGSNKEDHLPTHIVALEPSTLTIQKQNLKMQFDVSSIADISRIRHIKLAVLIATSDIDATAIQKVKVELLGKGNTKILLNDGPQSTNIIKSGKNANKLYAMMELAPELVQWWASEHINETHTIRLLLSQPFNIRSIAFQRPLLIFYYVPGFQERQQDAEMFQKMKSHARKIRSPHTPPKSCKRCVYAERKIPIADHQPHQSQNHHDQGCILHKWFVNLQDLNWDTMLIAPSGFYANYCSGRCYAPINNLLSNSSYNAVIRSLYNSNNQDGSKTVPAPHCVPTKLKSATFIYTENNGTRINFKELADVEAQECGCR